MDGIEKTSITDIDFSEINKSIRTMPMVALRGKVILPNVFTSFDVGRIKSLNAVNAAVDSEDSLIFVAAQMDARVENPTSDEICKIGTVCKILNLNRMPGDNIRVNVNALYTAQVVIKSADNTKYFEVGITEITPDFGDEVDTEAYARIVKNELKSYVSSDNVKLNKDTFGAILAIENSNESLFLIALR